MTVVYNEDAEKAVIGSILIKPEILFDIRDIITTEDFYVSMYKDIYDAIVLLHESRTGIDIVSVSNILKQRQKSHNLEILNMLYVDVPTEMHALDYARIVARYGFLRRLGTAGNQILQLASDSGESTLDEIKAKAETIVIDACRAKDNSSLIMISQLLGMVYDELETRSKNGVECGVKTSFSDLDRLTGGFQKSDLIYIGARPGMGKTSLMMDFARNAVYEHGKKVAVFSLEMSALQIVQRLLSVQSRIDTQKIRLGKINDNEWTQVVTALSELAEGMLFIDDTPGIAVQQIRGKLRRLVMEYGDIDMVIIDYLQLMQTETRYNNPVSEYTALSKAIKTLAREFNIPIVVGTQLSRAVEQRNDKRPILSDLRESGGLEQDADLVILLYRDDYYNKESEIPGVTELLLRKHRNGPTGEAALWFNKQFTTFEQVKVTREDLNF